VAGRTIDIVCTLSQPDDKLLPLLLAADTARELGAAKVNLIAPYLAYMRQDKRFHPGEAVSSHTFARLLSSSFDHLTTVDPHLHRYPALASVYTIPSTTLHATPLMADWIAANVARPLLVGPDAESEQWVATIAGRIGAPHVVLGKVRHGDRDVDIDVPDLSAWADHTPVLVDDIASSGRPRGGGQGPDRARPAQARMRGGACAVQRCHRGRTGTAVHAHHLDQRRPHPSNGIDLAPLIAQAIRDGVQDPPLPEGAPAPLTWGGKLGVVTPAGDTV
jgi:ribose-phosphate pyrophosphokinase